MKARFNITVLSTTEGYRARADELGLVSECFRRQRSAVKNMKDQLRAFIATACENGSLVEQLDKAGFVGHIGSGSEFIDVDLVDSQRVALSLPRSYTSRHPKPKEQMSREQNL